MTGNRHRKALDLIANLSQSTHPCPHLLATQYIGEAQTLLVPCADMANHDDEPNATWDLDEGVFRLVARRVRLQLGKRDKPVG